MTRAKAFEIGGQRVKAGTTRDIQLAVSQRYTGDAITLPIRVIRARRPGPTVLVSATIHGDEFNGTGIIHELMFAEDVQLKCGALVLVPVVNVIGFENQDRYMPDRRDLNRCFPGSEDGSLSSRVAGIFFEQAIRHCDYVIDLHTAAGSRTNFPNVRGDLSDPGVKRLAEAFGCEMIVNSKGPIGSLRREATKAGHPTIILEAGEPSKIEPSVLEIGVKGVHNVLKELGMLSGELVCPAYQTRISRSRWLRAENGGILRFHVSPGQPVLAGSAIATIASVFGEEKSVLTTPVSGLVLGMTTLPAVKPGEPVCHVAVPSKSLQIVRRALRRLPDKSLSQRLRDDLATNINVSEREGDWADPPQAEDDTLN